MLRAQVKIQNRIPVLTTTQVGERLGLKSSVDEPLSLGIKPVQRTLKACFWELSDMPTIRPAAAERALQVQSD